MSTHRHGNVGILKDDFNCPICFCSTHFGQTIICSKCEFWFHWKCVGITSEHSSVKNKKEHYFCYKCKFDLKDLKVVVEKMDLSRFYSFKCNVCPKKFMKSDEAKDHNLRIHQMICPTCEEKFDSKEKVENHIKNVHEESKISDSSKENSFLLGNPVWAKIKVIY